jgi:hypothetical protein
MTETTPFLGMSIRFKYKKNTSIHNPNECGLE